MEPSPPLAARLQVQQNVREQFIAIEEIKLLRKAVNECYYREGALRVLSRGCGGMRLWRDGTGLTRACGLVGVNHLENCKEEVAAYLARTRNGFPTWGALKEASNAEG